MATDTSYITSGNRADLVKLIKDYALFLWKLDDPNIPTMPDSETWTPPEGKKPVGYNSEDGAVLHPEPGDETEIKGHNGDIVVSEQEPGYWTLQIPGIECRQDIAEAYFGVKADTDGNFHVRDAATNIEYMAVLACLDQYGNPIVLPIGKCKVSDRDDMTLVSTEVVTFNVTFKMFKASDGYMFHVYGLLAAEKAGLATKVDSLAATPNTLTVAAGRTATFTATVNGNTVTVTGKSATETGKPVTITATAGGKNVTVPVTVTA